MFSKIVIIFLSLIIFFNFRKFLKLNRKQKVLKAKKLTTFNKKNLNNWMNLTKKERYNLTKQDSLTTLIKENFYQTKLEMNIRKYLEKILRGTLRKNNYGKLLDF